jgi:hypothetical protein
MSTKQYDPQQPVLSIHIPKCGGTSFESVLKKWFGDRLLLHYWNSREDKLPARYDLSAGMCVHGHFERFRGSGVLDYYPEVTQWFTIVRDPLQHFLSHYFYIKKNRNTLKKQPSMKQQRILADPYYNLKTHLESERSYMLAHFPQDITLENYQEILTERYLYIGITEDLQTSVNQLAGILGFPSVRVRRKNESKRDEALPDGIETEFRQNHLLEYAIYEFALNNYRDYSST